MWDGGHAALLALRGYSVHGVDFSPSMLERAAARRNALPLDTAARLTFVEGDVRNYRDGRKYDLVLSLFHVFSYQVENEDLKKTLATAATHLSPNGHLIFDYWYGPGVLRQQPEVRLKTIDQDQFHIKRQARPTIVPDADRVDVEYTVQVTNIATSEQRTIHERHAMRYLFVPELALLADPLFAIRDHYGWQTFRVPGFDDWSAVSILELRS